MSPVALAGLVLNLVTEILATVAAGPSPVGQWQVAHGLAGMQSNGECIACLGLLAAAGVLDPMQWGRSANSTGGQFSLIREQESGNFCIVTDAAVDLRR